MSIVIFAEDKVGAKELMIAINKENSDLSKKPIWCIEHFRKLFEVIGFELASLEISKRLLYKDSLQAFHLFTLEIWDWHTRRLLLKMTNDDGERERKLSSSD
jgi:hypothetical protein